MKRDPGPPPTNPRWLNCARVHGIDPHDVVVAEYVAWNGARLDEWCALHGVSRHAYLSDDQYAAYDAWLDAYPATTTADAEAP